MRVGLVAVGDELLDGRVADTSTSWLAGRLVEAGLTVAGAWLVGDDVDRIAGALAEAATVADVVVVLGGLGPTSDDVTREGIARWARLPLTDQPDRQAEQPAGGQVVPNPVGTAPGIRLIHEGVEVVALPGVPREMRAMGALLVAELGGRSGMPRRASVDLRVVLVAESEVARVLAPAEDRWRASWPAVTVSYLASPGEVVLHVSGPRGWTGGPEVVDDVRHRLGASVLEPAGSAPSLAAHVLARLREVGASLATAESLTGGLVGAELTSVPGSSDVYRGGVVSYATELKATLLDVPEALLAAHGPVHPDVAVAMACGVRHRLGTTYGLATTGVAGPAAQGGRAPGTVYAAVAGGGRRRVAWLVHPADRATVRRYAVVLALDTLRRLAQGEPAVPDREQQE
ncbi:MAG: nicotinamide-nucleotide amidohydrolase family protein [Actinomycetes bacterium]